jgi:hypothetical protein
VLIRGRQPAGTSSKARRRWAIRIVVRRRATAAIAADTLASVARSRLAVNPGTVYDDPTLGKDPQVGSMVDYVDTTDDNGGGHTNSGIPNRAFQLAATVAAAGDHASAAGVTPGSSATTTPTTSTGTPGQVVRVRRTGGTAGRTVEGSIDLAADSPTADAVRSLVDRIDPNAVAEPEGTMPDMFNHTFEIGGRSVTLPQHQLTDDQRTLADLLLSSGRAG